MGTMGQYVSCHEHLIIVPIMAHQAVQTNGQGEFDAVLQDEQIPYEPSQRASSIVTV